MENLTLLINFLWTSARALIYLTSISYHVTLTFEFDIKFYISSLCDKTYLGLPFTFKQWVLQFRPNDVSLEYFERQVLSMETNIIDLWPLPWILAYFLETLTLSITFQQWVVELWYFIWTFIVTRPFHWYQHFLPMTFDLF